MCFYPTKYKRWHLYTASPQEGDVYMFLVEFSESLHFTLYTLHLKKPSLPFFLPGARIPQE